MANWLIAILQFGGLGAVLVLMGKWLLKQITAALNSYVTAYAQETAKIDARIERLEKLAEEQARLTRTVESIKDEIAAQAKRRDNRWEFRKDVYVNLINATTDMLAGCSALLNSVNKQATFQKNVWPSLTTFLRHAGLAELATADPVPTLVIPPLSTR
jgi:50S ribosomal subunit-associated GTPase HflX